MTSSRRGTSYAAIALLLGMLGFAWLAFAPAALGGSASYVIINGSSMKPGLSPGDLVIVRKASAYQVGDVVTYQHPTIGPVIHRIVDRDGDRFILQGDSNSWLDSYNPGAAEIAGVKWLRVPSAGTVISHLRAPRIFPLVGIFVTGIAIMMRAKRPQSPAARRDAGLDRLQLLDAGSREAAGTLALIALLCLVLAVVAFSRSDQRAKATEIAFQQTGVFSYSAEAPAGIYDNAAVTTGDPIFREITERVTVAFDYHVSTDSRSDLSGTWSLVAVVSNTNGWQRTLPLAEPGTFTGTSATISGELDLAVLQQMIDSVAQLTSVRHDVNTVVIRPRIDVTGAVAGQPVQDIFAPELTFRLDAQQMRLVDGAATDPATLAPSRAGLLTLPGSEPNRLTLLGWDLRITYARAIAVSGLLLSLGLLGWIIAQAYRPQRERGIESSLAAHGAQLIEVTDLGPLRSQRLVSLASFDDLAILAARAGVPILCQQHDRIRRFVVHIGVNSYEHLGETPPAAGATVEPVPIGARAGVRA